MRREGGSLQWRLALARACAWGLLVAGWVGIGSFALGLAPTVAGAFALVALWLLALAGAAAVATRGDLRPWARAGALGLGAAAAAGGLLAAAQGGGVPALWVALGGWAAMTALASGVVRGLRLAQGAAPRPPVLAAGLGALSAGLALGDPGDLPALATRLAAFVVALAFVLLLLQHGLDGRRRSPGCRAGLFDCSLPAWPAGAWRELRQWPTLLAGLTMLPTMAALPLMATLCRAQAVPPQALLLLHLGAMFGPALLLQAWLAQGPPRHLATACAGLLAAGAAFAAWAPAPWDGVGLAAADGVAWGLAWGGQLWAPAQRARQGASPLIAAAGYALLTLAFGLVVEEIGVRGVAGVHVAMGVVAAGAWLLRPGLGAAARPAARVD